MEDRLLTIDEGRKILNCGRTYFYELIKTQKLKAVKMGRKTLVAQTEIEAFKASLKTYPVDVVEWSE